MKPQSPSSLLTVEDLRVCFRTRTDPIRAVDGVDFDIRSGETVALVGESGCGKSVTAYALIRWLASGGYIAGGRIRFDGRDVLALNAAELQSLRGGDIACIFQEPATSLNPVFRIGWQIAEAIRRHRKDVNAEEEVVRLLSLVGLSDAEHRARAYPHELSGGMQQRVMIAMALACRPRLLIADEPTTALDVTIQAQIIELLTALQRELGMAILLITHNLGLVADVASRVNVMYAGRIVETGPTERLLARPAHPYTQGLLAAVPRLNVEGRRLTGIPGTVPSPGKMPSGCRFHPRCSTVKNICRTVDPGVTDLNEGHSARCHCCT